MSSLPTLPVSGLVAVSVTLAPVAVQSLNLQSMLILGSEAVINTVERLRSYDSLEEVAVDFGTNVPEYFAARDWFAQSPQPTQLYIGRWAATATSGQLIGAPLTPAQQLPSAWTGITAGTFKITINGGSAVNITGLDFASDTNMDAVAATIQAAITTATVAATIVWNPTYNRFEITSNTTGSTSAVLFLQADTGVDVSAPMMMTAANAPECYEVQGIAVETALAAVAEFDVQFGQLWFALSILGVTNSAAVSVAEYIQAAANYHYYGTTTQEAAAIELTGDTTSLPYLLSQVGGLSRTCCQYSSTDPYAVVSLLARILTTDYTGNNTVIDLMWKNEPTVTPEFLTSSQGQALANKSCNVFAQYNNNTAIIQTGISSAGIPYYIDTIIGSIAWALAVQTAVFNLIYSNSSKIPQTDGGMHQIQTTIEAVCIQFVNNGLLAPGVWDAVGFGNLNEGDYLSKGYYVYAPPIASQSLSDRAKRISVPFQVAGKLAGAVNTVNVAITLSN